MAKLSALLSRVKIKSARLADPDREVGALCTDSFGVSEGDAFICVPGTQHDGHDFICIAHDRGASLIIAERMTPYLEAHDELDCVIVENTRLAAAQMWNELCGRPSDRMIFVAVTGTNGKTSTTYLMREIFKAAGYVTGLIGTVKCISGERTDIIGESGVNSMTTPPPEKLYPELARMADEGVEIVFLEASSHALSQYRLDPIGFELAVFTNLTPEHLDYHGTMENYFASKRRLLELSRTAAVNLDDEWFKNLADGSIPTVTYSAKRDADFRAVNSSCRIGGESGISYTLVENGAHYPITCPIPGEFTVYNTLAAATAARLFGIKPGVIQKALAVCPQIPGRMERLEIPERLGFEVYIDYAHTPDALERALGTLRHRRSEDGRLIAVFGCGGDRDKSKRPVMGRIAAQLADLVIITGDNSRTENPRSIIFDIVHGIPDRSRCRVIERREAAIRAALGEARPGDVVLLAGKGHEDYEIDSSGKHPFSEKSIVLDALGEKF